MTRYELRYHPDVRAEDVPLLDSKTKQRIMKAIESRLGMAPEQYGSRLRKTLHGYWKLRVGDYRVVYSISKNTVWILAIIHRKRVYQDVEKRSQD